MKTQSFGPIVNLMIELSELDIDYLPQSPMKGKALEIFFSKFTNFLVEI